MSLTPGTRLGSYEVLAKLGEGGMGEVSWHSSARFLALMANRAGTNDRPVDHVVIMSGL